MGDPARSMELATDIVSICLARPETAERSADIMTGLMLAVSSIISEMCPHDAVARGRFVDIFARQVRDTVADMAAK